MNYWVLNFWGWSTVTLQEVTKFNLKIHCHISEKIKMFAAVLFQVFKNAQTSVVHLYSFDNGQPKSSSVTMQMGPKIKIYHRILEMNK